MNNNAKQKVIYDEEKGVRMIQIDGCTLFVGKLEPHETNAKKNAKEIKDMPQSAQPQNMVEIFNNAEFGSVRTTVIDGEPFFVGKDIAEVLGYSNPRKVLADHVDSEDKKDGVTIRDSIGREQTPILINESGLYSLILRSQLPSAKQFKRWVTSEVLPSIRKHGAYVLPEVLQKAIDDPEYMQHLLHLLEEDQKKRMVTTVQDVKLNDAYHEWCNRQVTPLINKLQSFHPTYTTYQILNASYKALLDCEGYDVHALREKFVEIQMNIAKENNISCEYDDFRVPLLYIIYSIDVCNASFTRLLYDLLVTEYKKTDDEEVAG